MCDINILGEILHLGGNRKRGIFLGILENIYLSSA